MNIDDDPQPAACGPGCDCAPPSPIARRDFLSLSGLAIIGTALGRRPAVAGPFEAEDFARLIPPDKKLRPEWVRSLTERGEPEVYTKAKNELRFIGMPIGGICCGTVYLGGDGKLWVWDIFNRNQNGILPRTVRWDGFGQARNIGATDGAAYVEPHTFEAPFAQGFAVRVSGVTRKLDVSGWDNITFRGTYPIGTVDYSDSASPISVRLVAYSPFIPLDVDDSGLPATICEFTLHNLGAASTEVEIGGWLENSSSQYSAQPGSGLRVNAVSRDPAATILDCRFAEQIDADALKPTEPDIVVGDWSSGNYGTWTVQGNAFGASPIARKDVPGYQGDLGGEGDYLVNTHSTGPGANVNSRDSGTGTLTSAPFTITRRYLAFPVGGGANINEEGIRLIVDGATLRRAGGRDNNHMSSAVWDLGDLRGKIATIEIYDHGTGPWGNVGIGRIVMTDVARADPPGIADHDYGTMALALLGQGVGHAVMDSADAIFSADAADRASHPVGQPLVGGVTAKANLAPGASATLTFVVAWHFPNPNLTNVTDSGSGNYYATRFADARAVATYVAANHARLSHDTHLWRDTWYDSTLPHWFLDRTFANTSILATTTAHRFGTGRFWGWEGIGCCEGTCTHVWHYAQAPGRIFPEFERHTREFVDFGVAFDPKSGQIGYRGEHTGPAVDGQCGRILGAYREHTMSPNDAFLRRVYPRVREAIDFLIRHDSNGDGLIDGAQENTLDAAWFGKIAWISSLYAAALRAGEVMAAEVGDDGFARQCADRLSIARAAIESELFNGEYFIQKPEPGHEGALGTYETCHIDQVHGQSWAWQVALGRILDRDKTVSALRALYRYNFTPDVGAFRRRNMPGRAYALAGDGGLIMATNPRERPHAFGNSADWQYGYFNECMSGFEHQAASHMIAEGLVTEGMAITKAIHERYHAAKRNPYNEIECSDHYSRAMASYGSFVSACGFEYHGPSGHVGFSPRIHADNFRAAFTAAEGWGTFAQKRTAGALTATIAVKHGRLALRSVSLAGSWMTARATIGGKTMSVACANAGDKTRFTLPSTQVLLPGDELRFSVTA